MSVLPKKYWNTEIEHFPQSTIWHKICLSQRFCPWLSLKKCFCCQLNSKAFFTVLLQLQQLSYIKVPKLDLLDNYFWTFFTEVQIWYWKTFKFGLRHFFRKVKCFAAKRYLFLAFVAVSKDIKCNRKFYNHDHDILRIFYTLLNWSVTKREMEHGYW